MLNTFLATFAIGQLIIIWYLARRLARTEDRHAAAVAQAEEALHRADIALKAVEHLQKLNAQIRRHRNALILNGELFAPYTVGNNTPPTVWRIYPKQ